MATYYYVYVLQSAVDKNFYTGFTRNLLRRTDDHHTGKVYSTRRRMPLELIYWEGCTNKADAIKREKYLKTAWGKRYVKNRLKHYLTG